MKFGSRRRILGALGTAMVCLLGVARASGQAAPPQKPLMADDVFKNIQVLKGLTVTEFMDTMGVFSADLGLNCTHCHLTEALEDWSKFADDVPRKKAARQMILMVNALNKSSFGGRPAVTCYTCHRGTANPKVIPSLTDQYSTPGEQDADEVEIHGEIPPGTPSPDQVLDKYIQGLGGAQKLAALTSFTAKGVYSGFETDFVKMPVEIFAKAPGQRTMVLHTPLGESTWTFDGRNGWVALTTNPVPLIQLPPGGDLDGAKLDADLCFPGGIKQALTAWRTGFPETTVDDKDAIVVQGTGANKARVKLYFDKKSGLLLRSLRYTSTAVGLNPTRVDYSDYRDVADVKMPFHIVVTWTDGQATIELSEIQPNTPVDAAKFARPAPAVVKKEAK